LDVVRIGGLVPGPRRDGTIAALLFSGYELGFAAAALERLGEPEVAQRLTIAREGVEAALYRIIDAGGRDDEVVDV